MISNICYDFVYTLIAQGKFVTSTPLPNPGCVGNADQSYISQKSSRNKMDDSIFKKPAIMPNKPISKKTTSKHCKEKEVALL